MGYARHTIGHAPPIRLACRGSLDSVLVFSGCLGWVVSIGAAHLGRFGGVLAALVPRADRVGGGRLFGLGIGGWPRMDVRGTWWSIGTGLNGQLDLFSAIRGAHRLTMVCNLIQTTLGLVWLFPKFFPTTLWFITQFLDRLQTYSVVRLSYLIDPSLTLSLGNRYVIISGLLLPALYIRSLYLPLVVLLWQSPKAVPCCVSLLCAHPPTTCTSPPPPERARADCDQPQEESKYE